MSGAVAKGAAASGPEAKGAAAKGAVAKSAAVRGTVATGARRLLGVIVALVAIAGVAVFVASALGLVRLVPVLSNSMAPGMPVGSLAVTLPVDQAAVRAGDVIVFTDPDVPERRVIHRVTSVYSEADAAELRGWTPGLLALTTKGDNNPQADPWIVTIADDRIWREESVVPLLGWPSILLAQPQARFAFFAIGGALVVGAVLVVIWRRPAEARS